MSILLYMFWTLCHQKREQCVHVALGSQPEASRCCQCPFEAALYSGSCAHSQSLASLNGSVQFYKHIWRVLAEILVLPPQPFKGYTTNKQCQIYDAVCQPGWASTCAQARHGRQVRFNDFAGAELRPRFWQGFVDKREVDMHVQRVVQGPADCVADRLLRESGSQDEEFGCGCNHLHAGRLEHENTSLTSAYKWNSLICCYYHSELYALCFLFLLSLMC